MPSSFNGESSLQQVMTGQVKFHMQDEVGLPLHILYTNSKWINNLKIKTETVKLLEETQG